MEINLNHIMLGMLILVVLRALMVLLVQQELQECLQ
jgi:hypothetical protein